MPLFTNDVSEIYHRNKLFIKIIGVIFFLLLGYFFGVYIKTTGLTGAQNADNSSIIVTLTEEGYRPEITIKKGTMVTFKSELDKPFWPASNLHPSHEIYSDFDPGVPLNADETWSFVFNRVGQWQMHDHIRSYFTGTITVIE